MDVMEIINIIQTIGFPIAMCLIFCYYIKYQNDNHREDMDNINTKHKEEAIAMTEALTKNTEILAELKTLIENIR